MLKTQAKRPKLILEIAVVIACKLLFIFGLWYFFFSPAHRPLINPETVGNAILFDQASPTQTNIHKGDPQ